MTALMLSGRELRNVPLDFDWPRERVWEGYLMPRHLLLEHCTQCSGSGYSAQAQQLERTFYDFDRDATGNGGWNDKLTQDDVDYLLANGRLRTWVTDDSQRGGAWQTLPLTAQQVNDAQRGGPMADYAHDGINRYLLIKHRCEQLAAPHVCSTCDGQGEVGTPEQRAAHDAWQPTDPPTGDGIQMWETVSEGSPVSPVFANSPQGRLDLAAWLSEHHNLVGSLRSRDEWMRIFDSSMSAVNLQTGEVETPDSQP